MFGNVETVHREEGLGPGNRLRHQTIRRSQIGDHPCLVQTLLWPVKDKSDGK